MLRNVEKQLNRVDLKEYQEQIASFFNTVGISYGFTMILFSIIRFISPLNVGQKASKIITMSSVSVISLLIAIMIMI
jgi:hypothetical protein